MLRNVIPSCFAVSLLVPFGGCESNSGGEPAAGSDTPTGAGNRDAAAGDTGRAGTGGSDSGAGGEVAGGECSKNPDDPSRFVIIGFWHTTDCSGDPIMTNAFPVDGAAGCYCWPGHSGANSANEFACDPANGSFSYTQFIDLTCGGQDPDGGTRKTSYTDRCEQDIPGDLHARILDIGACAE